METRADTKTNCLMRNANVALKLKTTPCKRLIKNIPGDILVKKEMEIFYIFVFPCLIILTRKPANSVLTTINIFLHYADIIPAYSHDFPLVEFKQPFAL